MEHRISVLFYARNSKKTSKGLSPIYIRLTINGRRLEQSIGRSINPGLWSPSAGRVKGNNDLARQVNQYLDTLKQIGVQLAETHELPKRQVEALFGDMIDAIVKQMKKGAKVRISGLGILQVKKRAARMGRNPATGEAIKIKASKKVAFRVAKDLKEAI